MKPLRWILTIGLTAALGCTSSKSYKSEQRQLKVARLSGVADTEKGTTSWSLINHRDISVTACLEDVAKRQAAGQRWWNIGGQGLNARVQSTVDGCVTWKEPVDFEPAVQPIYIPFERTIKDADGKFDAVKVEFRLNPWSGEIGDEPIFNDPQFPQDVKVADAGQALLALSKGAGGSNGSLLADPISFEFAGTSAALNLDFHPVLLTHAMDGSEARIPIENGKMTVRFEILFQAASGGTLVPMHQTTEQKGVVFQDGLVHLEKLPLNGLQAWVKDQGTYYMRLQLIPENAPGSLSSFENIFLIGSFSHLANGAINIAPNASSLRIDRTQFEQRIAAKPVGNGNGSSWVTAPAKPVPSDGLSFDLGTIQPAMDEITDEDTLLRHVQFRLSVEVINTNPNGTSLEGQEFEIYPTDNPKAPPYRKKVKGGHLDWTDVITNYYYASVSEMHRDIKFKNLKDGSVIIRRANLTPWVRFCVLFVDATQLTDPEKAHLNAGGKLWELNLISPCLSIDRRDFSIDPMSMNLMMTLPTTVRFSPVIRRFDEPLFGQYSMDGLRAGHYLLTMVVYNLDLDDAFNHPISVGQQIVHYAGSGATFQSQINLKLNDLSFGLLRNFVAVDVRFLDPYSLKDAAGNIVDPETANKNEVAIVDGTLVPREKLAMAFPPQVFPYSPAAGTCGATAIVGQNAEDLQIKQLTQQMADKKIDLLQVVTKWRADQAKIQPSAQKMTEWEHTGWRDAAKQWGLTPFEIDENDQVNKVAGNPTIPNMQTRALGYEEQVSSTEDLHTALECMYKINEQSDDMPAKCQYQIGEPIWRFCQAMGIHWMNEALADAAKRGDTRPGLYDRITVPFFKHCFDKNETRKYVRVRKYIHPYGFASTEKLKQVGGYRSDLTLHDGLTIGTDHGSDLEAADTVSFALQASAKVKVQATQEKFLPLISGAAGYLNQLTGGRADDVVQGKMLESFQSTMFGMDKYFKGVKGKIGVGVGADARYSSFRWAFYYNIPYNAVSVSTTAALSLESMPVQLDLTRFRECYAVEPDISRDDWEGLLISQDYDTGFRPRMYICFNAHNERRSIVENFYAVYNDPENGAEIDNGRAAQRWFLLFRGERDYQVFLQNLRAQYDLVYRGSVQVPDSIMTAIGGMRTSTMLNRPGFPGALAAPYPGKSEYYNMQPGDTPPVSGFAALVDWLSKTFNPWETYGTVSIPDQQHKENQIWKGQDQMPARLTDSP